MAQRQIDRRSTNREDIFRTSDVVSLNCALGDDNVGLVDAHRLRTMKRSALLVNTARGQLVVEEDLAEALEQGTIAGAALDIVSEERILRDSPLLDATNCIITPHMAWTSLAARRRLMETTVANIEAFLCGEPLNVVT